VLLLDCGTGHGLALLAAATAGAEVEVWGATAFAEEAAAARALAAEADLELRVLEAAPDRLAARADLPDFDLVAAPSGWTRLSGAERGGVVALLTRRLAPGGAFLLTRETLPGAMERVLLRRVLRHALEVAGEAGTASERVAAALALAGRLLPQSHLLVRLLVNWEAALAWLASMPPEVALREWFGPEGPAWTAAETAAALAPAGLAAGVPADPFAAPADLTLAPEQRALIEAARDPSSAAETAAMLLGDDRRSELFVKPGGAAVALESLRFARTAEPWREPLRPAGFGERAALDAAAHAPAFEALEAAPAPSVAEIAARGGAGVVETAERLRALAGAGLAAPALEAAPGAAARAASARLNRLLLARGPIEALAAPRLGGAAPLGDATRRALAEGGGEAARAALARLGGL